MAEGIDKEIDAIKTVLAALEPLSREARLSVLDYAIRRLGIQYAGTASSQPPQSPLPAATLPQGKAAATVTTGTQEKTAPPVHIEKLKDEKKPRSANEMSAIVAYFLAHVAPEGQRKTTVTTHDMETYFRIARFPLPKQIRVTLQNAKNAGYFDAVGDGEYKLNAIGYNLVAHNMPRGGSGEKRSRPSKRTKSKPKGKGKSAR
ncbi:MAG: hypothetical protein WC769_13465 [Thermodesulfovibrionales bacterium]|jgi:hypothetical protein